MFDALRTALLSILLAAPGLAFADDDHYDRVHLGAGASETVQNDSMTAILFAEVEGSELAPLSRRVNDTVRQALDALKAFPRIQSQTYAYSSYTVMHKNRITGWRVKQSIELKSQDFASMSQAIGRLQKNLAVQSIQFSVSPALREQTQKRLIDKALDAFSGRAQQVARKLGRSSYKIVDINIGTGGASPRPVYAMRAMHVEADSAPALAAGEQTVSVNVSGTIELE